MTHRSVTRQPPACYNRPMKAAAVLALFLAAPAAHAMDCDAYPFGDTAANVSALSEIFNGPGQMSEVMPLMAKVCKSKFMGESRDSLYEIGMTDRDIDGYGTARVTLIWLTDRLRRIAAVRLPQ